MPDPVTLFVADHFSPDEEPYPDAYHKATPAEVLASPIVAEVVADRAQAVRDRNEALSVLASIGTALDDAGIEAPAICQHYPQHVRDLLAERDRLRAAVEGARDTFADFDLSLTILRHYVGAEAARVAHRAMQDALAAMEAADAASRAPGAGGEGTT